MTAENTQKKEIRKIGDRLLCLYSRAFLHFARGGWTDRMPDALYLRMNYLARMGKLLHLQKPEDFNEKLQWLKLYYRRPELTTLVDKYAAKQWAADRIGQEYIIPVLGVWDSFDDIDFDSLPDQFVLKCTHDSGGLVIVKDKASLDLGKAREKLEKSLNTNYYYHGREWYYKNVKPRILAEKYMEASGKTGLTDYKYLCFGGEAKAVLVCTDRYTDQGLHVTAYDRDWRKLPVKRALHKSRGELPQPSLHHKMLELAEVLSDGLPFVRVDLFEINGRAYFGEMTFFPFGGFESFTPGTWDRQLGQWLKLPEKYR